MPSTHKEKYVIYDKLTIKLRPFDPQLWGCSRYFIVKRLVLALDLCFVIHSNTRCTTSECSSILREKAVILTINYFPNV